MDLAVVRAGAAGEEGCVPLVARERYVWTSTGDKKGSMKLPIVVSTTVKASLPCAWRVMTTLLEMVVGRQLQMIRPTSRAGPMKSLLVAQAVTMAKTVAEVMRKHCSATKRWIRQRA